MTAVAINHEPADYSSGDINDREEEEDEPNGKHAKCAE